MVRTGYIYTSTDTGNTWVQKTTDTTRDWYSVAMTSNGQYQTAVVNNGYIYTSTDTGNTWIAKITFNGYWVSVAMSSNGQYQSAISYRNYIYTSNISLEITKDISVNNIVIYDRIANDITRAGSIIQNGVNGAVNTFYNDVSNQILYIGGNFTTANDVSNSSLSTKYVASWNLATQRWSQLGLNANNGTGNTVNAIVYNPVNSNLYVGGNFTTTSDSLNTSQTANQIASWNTNAKTWSRLGTAASNGTSGVVSGMDIDISNQIVYIGGTFNIVRDSRVVDISINNFAKWNISRNQWVGVGGYSNNGTNGIINSYTYDNSNNIIYCGGNFTKVFDTSNIELNANYIAIWNVSGQYWSQVGTNTSNGTSGVVKTLDLDMSNQSLYVGGTFTIVRDSRRVDFSMNNIAKWDIAYQLWNGIGRYSNDGNGTNGTIYAYAYDSSNNILYCGGNFIEVYDTSNIVLNAYYIAGWDISGQYWSLIGTPTSNGTSGLVDSLEIDIGNQILYVGGNTFNAVKDSRGTITSNNIAAWNIVNRQWSSLGTASSNGVNGGVYAIDRNTSSQILYVAGNFTAANDARNVNINTNYIASWNIATQRWSALGLNGNNGTNNVVNAIVYNSVNSNLYVGGNFTATSDSVNTSQTSNRIASWNTATSQWSRLGTSASNGTNGVVNAMDIDVNNQVIYVGGSFSVSSDSSGNKTVDNLAKWNVATNQWSVVRSYVSKGAVNVVSYYNANSNLYVGGNAGDVAIYNTISDSSWVSVLAMNSAVYAFSPYTNTKLYIGGVFTKSTVTFPDPSSGTLITSTFGTNWIAKTSPGSRDWRTIAMSSTGEYQTARDIGAMYMSSDYGNSWVQKTTTMVDILYKMAISSTGQYQTAVQFSGSVYTSNDFGITWTEKTTQRGNHYWYDVAISSTGQYLSATDGNTGGPYGYIYTSNDFGNTWTPRTQRSNWYGIAMSSTGQYQTAGNSGTGYIYTSNDYGYNWTEKTNYGIQNFGGIAISSTGQYQTAVAYNGHIFTSSDTGNSWVKKTSDASRTWQSVAMSSTGQFQIAAVMNGFIYASNNYGNTWVENTSAGSRSWRAVAMSSNGQYVSAVSQNNYIYTNTNDLYLFRTQDASVNNIAFYDSSAMLVTPTGSAIVKGISNGVNADVYTIDRDLSNQILYVGGNFTKARDSSNVDISTNYIASWNIATQRWSPLGLNGSNGTNSYVNSIVYNPVNSNMYIGGNFTTTSDSVNTSQTANRVASWNTLTSQWSRLGTSASNGTSGIVNAIDIDISNQIVYIGGTFNIVRDNRVIDLSMNNIAKWNISTSQWSTIGGNTVGTNGTNGAVNTLVYKNNKLYVGGNFTLVRDGMQSDPSANYVAIWNNDTSRWSTLGTNTVGTNGTNIQCNTIAYDASNQILYVGGSFTTIKDTVATQLANYNAAWNTQTNRWSIFGTVIANGTNGAVNTVVYNNNKLYVGGNFTLVKDGLQSDPSANYVAIWNNSTSTWSTLGGNTVATNGINGQPYAIAYDASNQLLYVGGNFTIATDASSTLTSNYNTAWNIQTSRWSRFGAVISNGTNAQVNALAYYNNNLYVGGQFTSISGETMTMPANRIAVWNNSTKTWSLLGTNSSNGTNNLCYSMTFNNKNNKLYVGGNFTTVSDSRNVAITTNRIAAWDLSKNQWSGLGGYASNGTDLPVYTYAYDSCKNILYCGGRFATVYDTSNVQLTVNNIAAWNINGQYWTALGIPGTNNGTNAQVSALSMDSINQILYVGGQFTVVKDGQQSDPSANYVAAWNVSTGKWSTLGGNTSTTNGLDNRCYSLAFDNSNAKLYVGGIFRKVRDGLQPDQSANRIAVWNISTSRWSVLGSVNAVSNGLNGDCNAISIDNINNMVYVGGAFTIGYDFRNGSTITSTSISYIGGWNNATNSWFTLGSSGSNGCNGTVSSLAFDPSNQFLYTAGNFTTVSDSATTNKAASYVAYYNLITQRWLQFGIDARNGVTLASSTILLDRIYNRVYVGGTFTTAYDQSLIVAKSANYIAYWDLVNKVWYPLGTTAATNNGLSGDCLAIAVDSCGNVFAGGNHTSVKDYTSTSISANYTAQWNPVTTTWARKGSIIQNGTNVIVYSMTLDNSNQTLYAGGTFTTVSDLNIRDISANYIAAWNIVTERWSPLGVGTFNGGNNTFWSMKFDNSNNRLYVGGAFSLLNDASNRDLAANWAAYWNVTSLTWNTLGNSTLANTTNNGFSQIPNAIVIDNSGNIYFGGQFTNVYDSDVNGYNLNRNAVWNPQTNRWVKYPVIRNGVNTTVNAIAVDNSNQIVYAAGSFTTINDISSTGLAVNYIAAWNQSTQRWQRLGQDANNGVSTICYSLQFDSSNSRLYVSGSFTTTNDVSNVGQSARYIAYWNPITQRWSPLGTVASNGVDAYANSLIFDGCGNLFVAGLISTAYDTSASNILYWTPANTWSRLVTDGVKNTQNGTNGQINSIAMVNNKLYIGGAFTTVNDVSFSGLTSNYVSSWDVDSQRWSPLGGTTSATNGLNNTCIAMVYDNCSNLLYIGGNNFTKVSDTTGYDLSANNIAAWNIKTNSWWPLGSSIGFANNGLSAGSKVNALSITKDRQLFIGGTIAGAADNLYNVTARNALIWNPSTYKFSVLGGYSKSGFNTYANAMILDSNNTNLYIGGQFTTMNDGFNEYNTNYNAVYNVSSTGLRLLGDFSNNGLNGIPNVFTMDTNRNILYIGGKFTKASDSSRINVFSPNFVAYDISNNIWLDIDTPSWGGVNGEVFDMIFDGNTGLIYVAGLFTNVYDSSNTNMKVNYMAVYNTNTKKWGRLGSPDASNNGTNGIIRKIAFDDRNNKLYVGGDFTTVYDSVNNTLNIRYIASLSLSTNTWSRFGSSRYNDLNANVVSINYSNISNDLFVFGNFTNVTSITPLNTYSIEKFATFYF